LIVTGQHHLKLTHYYMLLLPMMVVSGFTMFGFSQGADKEMARPLAAFAYLLLERLRTRGLAGTDWARATVGSVRVRLLKVAAQVRVSVRRVYVQMNSAYAWQERFRRCHERLLALRAASG